MSILENLIAITIVIVAIFASINVTLSSLKMSSDGKVKTLALTIASNKIEELQALPFNSSQLTAGMHEDSSVGLKYPGHNVVFTLKWKVKDNDPISGVKKVDVIVEYKYRNTNIKKKVSMLILLSKP